MKDRGIFINERVSSGELVDAGRHLGAYGLRVSDWGYNQAAKLPKYVDPILARQQLDPARLKGTLVREWTAAEDTAARLLISTGTLAYPRDVVLDAKEDLRQEDAAPFTPSSQRDSIVDFFAMRLVRLELLEKQRTLTEFGSVVWTSLIYEESAIIRGAVMNHVYYEGQWT